MIKLKSLLFEAVEKPPLTVYHGTDKKFRAFTLNRSTQGIIWFTSDKDKIKKNEAGAAGKGYIITANVTINNPAGWAEYDKLLLQQLQSQGYDGAILPSRDGQFDCFVFSPKQVKILDIEKYDRA